MQRPVSYTHLDVYKRQAVNDSSTGASIVVFGTPYVVDDSYDNAVSGNNADMFKDVITSMTGNVELASSVIPVKDYTLSNITCLLYTSRCV